MFKRFLVACLFLVTACCTFNFNVDSDATQSKKPSFDVNKTYKSIGMIVGKSPDGRQMSGAGFAINKNQIMTAGHVCAGILQYQAAGVLVNDIFMQFYAPDDETILETNGLRILKIDAKNDICLLQKDGHGLAPVKFTPNYSGMPLHTTVYIVGAPLGVFATSFEGKTVLKDSKDMYEGMPSKLTVDAAAAPGNSGSPVFNAEGFVVGMLVAGPNGFDHVSICTASPYLVYFINHRK
ncbi:MAG: serine protease [Patescibacteria group bacterium]